MPIPNPVIAIIDFLQADAQVTTVMAARVFGAELPPAEVSNMPRECAVIKASGGPGSDMGYMKTNRNRYEIRTYGRTPLTAWDAHLAVHDALKQMVPTVTNNTKLNNAVQVQGPMQLRDPDVNWPFVLSSYSISASEVTVT